MQASSSSKKSQKEENERYLLNTPPVRRGRPVQTPDTVRDAMQLGWEEFIARHRGLATEEEEKPKYFQVEDNRIQHQVEEETWKTHQEQRRRNYKRRQKKKKDRDATRRVVKTLK